MHFLTFLYRGNWANFTIDNWVAESADAAAAEQAAQFGGIAFPVKYLEPLSWSCAVRLWWPLGACKPIAGSSTMCSVQNVQFCHFLGAWCWDLTMPLHILLLCNDLAYSIHWSQLSLVHSIGFSLLDIALQFIVWHALYLTPPGHPSIPSRSTYSTMVLHPSYSRYLNPFEIGQIVLLCAIACTAKIPLTPLGAIKQISLRSVEFAQCTL